MTRRHWLIALVLIALMWFLGATFLYGVGHVHENECRPGHFCVQELADV